MKEKKGVYATLNRKYKAGVVFSEVEALIKVLRKTDTIIYLVEDTDMSDGSNKVTLRIHYK